MEAEVLESEILLPSYLSFKKIQMYEKYPKGQSRGRHWKHLKQIIQAENYQNCSPDEPTYRRGMDDAIREMHGLEFGDKIISVNKAQHRAGQDDVDHGYKGGYSSGGRGSHGIGNRSVGQDECFKCGRPGHWARDCPSGSGGGGGGSGSYTSRSRYGEDDGRGDRFGGRSQFFNDHFDGRHFVDRDRYDRKNNKYESHDRYVGDRYSSGGDRFASCKYGEYDRYSNVYAKDRLAGSPRGGADRYGIGRIARDEGRSYKSRPGPYDRPNRGGKPSSYERY